MSWGDDLNMRRVEYACFNSILYCFSVVLLFVSQNRLIIWLYRHNITCSVLKMLLNTKYQSTERRPNCFPNCFCAKERVQTIGCRVQALLQKRLESERRVGLGGTDPQMFVRPQIFAAWFDDEEMPTFIQYSLADKYEQWGPESLKNFVQNRPWVEGVKKTCVYCVIAVVVWQWGLTFSQSWREIFSVSLSWQLCWCRRRRRLPRYWSGVYV